MVKASNQPDVTQLELQLSTNWLELADLSLLSGVIAGVDEVGRGALFGPVVAGAVILPPEAVPALVAAKVNDSKQLSLKVRQQLAQHIKEVAVDCQIGYATVAEIDRLNILQASLLAMRRAIIKLKVQPTLCLIDGNQPVQGLAIPQQTLVKGDQRSVAIASASIIAKVWRDDLLLRLATKYPLYDLHHNKGYGSKKHLMALQAHGASPLHRQSFRPCQIEAKVKGQRL